MKFSFIVIDDRDLDCFIAEKMINKTSFCNSVHCFNHPKLALQSIAENANPTPTIILLDVMMPVMNGFQFMDEFEKLEENIKSKYKIIAITTSLNKNDIHRISGYERVNFVLKKPYNFDDLKETIEKTIEN